MAHQIPALIMLLCAFALAGGPAASQDGAVQKNDPAPANDARVEPIVPPLPPGAAALNMQCAVPQSTYARQAPLTNTAARIEAGKKVRVLAIGSSSTWSGNKPTNYPSRLEKMLETVLKGVNIEVVNRGVSGEIAAVSARRLINEAAILHPQLVLWQLGTHDAVARVPLAEFETTVRATVRMLHKNNIDVVLVGLQYTPKFARDEHWFEIRAALERIANEENLLYVRRERAMEFLAQTRAATEVSGDDEFSLTDLGFPCMAEHIAQAMVANIFLRRSGDRRGAPPGPPPAR
jgi:lysophospholipase L1-like esterase